MTAPAAPAAPGGPLFDAKYQLLRTIGEGGMGAVHEAVNVRTGKHVAIKTMSPLISRDPHAVERFMREARAATMIEHPNVVQVFDVGVEPSGVPFMVMELLQGEPLTDVIEREGPLSPARLVQIMGPALGALAAAHSHGIIHRDLKPDNIFVARTPGTGVEIPKLLDFGISKSLDPNGQNMSLTHTGTLLGTPYYMAPEQAAGKRTVDQRSDIYAVGVILYYALSRYMPFNGENYNALIVAILTEEAPPLVQVAPHVPPAVAEVVERAMKREMDQRYQSVEELVGALAYAAGQAGFSMASASSDQSFAQVAAGNTARHVALQQSGITAAASAATTPPVLHQTPHPQAHTPHPHTPHPHTPHPHTPHVQTPHPHTPHPGYPSPPLQPTIGMPVTPAPGVASHGAWAPPNVGMQATPAPGAPQAAWSPPNVGMQATPAPGGPQASWSAPTMGMQATPAPGALAPQAAWVAPSAPAVAATPMVAAAPKKSSLPLVLVGIVGLLALLGGGAAVVVLFLLPASGPAEPASAVASEPAQVVPAVVAPPVAVEAPVVADVAQPVADPAAPTVEPSAPAPDSVAVAAPPQTASETEPSGSRRRPREGTATPTPEPERSGTRPRSRSGGLDLSEF